MPGVVEIAFREYERVHTFMPGVIKIAFREYERVHTFMPGVVKIAFREYERVHTSAKTRIFLRRFWNMNAFIFTEKPCFEMRVFMSEGHANRVLEI